jgi:hypothetical protein
MLIFALFERALFASHLDDVHIEIEELAVLGALTVK